jgi:hypothetical protein
MEIGKKAQPAADQAKPAWIAAAACFILAQGALWFSPALATLLLVLAALSVGGGFLMRRRPAPRAAMPARPSRRGPGAAPQAPPAGAGFKELLASFGPTLRDLAREIPENLAVPAWLAPALGVPFLLFAQLFILQGRGTLAFAATGLFFLCCFLYTRMRHSHYVFPRLKERLAGLGLALCAAPLILLGSKMMWDYQRIYLGFFLNGLGLAGLFWTLHKFSWLDLADVAPAQESYSPLGQLWASADARLGSLPAQLILLAAGAGLWVMGNRTPSPGTAIYFYVAGAAGVLLAFPLLKREAMEALLGGQRALKGVMEVSLFVGALGLAWHGQNMLLAGQTSGGALTILAGGALLSFIYLKGADLGRPRAGLSGWEGRAEVAVFMLLLAGIAFLRFWKTGTFPYGIEGDEAGGGLVGEYIRHKRTENVFIHENIALPFFSVTALFYQLFDVSPYTTRLHAMVFGTLSAAGFYFFARYFYGRAVSVLVTLLMATGYWHLHYSRFGHYNMEQVMMQMPAFYFAFKGFQENRFRHWLLAGAALGLAMQPHLASRVLPFGFLLFAVILLACKPGQLRRSFSGIVVLALAAYMVVSPCLLYWMRAIPLSMGRAKSVSIFDKTNTSAPRNTMEGVVQNFKTSALMFNVQGDTRSRNLLTAPRPTLDRWTGAIFALALIWACLTWRDPLHAFLLCSFLVNFLVSVFSVEAPQALRSAGNILLVYCFIGSLLARVKGSVEEIFSGLALPSRKRVAGLVFLAAALPLAVGAAYQSLHTYFVEFSNVGYDVLPTEIGIRAKIHGTGTKNMFFATGFASGHPPLLLFGYGRELNNYYELLQEIPLRESASEKSTAAYLCDSYQQAEPLFKALYPGATYSQIKDYAGRTTLFTEILIAPEDIKKSHQMELQVTSRSGRVEKRLSQGLKLKGDEPWLAGAARLSWEGTVFMQGYGHWQVWGQGQGASSVVIDGRPASQAQSRELAAGMHRIKVTYTPRGAGPFSLRWQGRPVNPRGYWNVIGGIDGEVPESNLFGAQNIGGLTGEVYPNLNLEGKPLTKRIDPMIIFHWLDNPIQSVISIRWKGKVLADAAGDYAFQVPTCAYSRVRVDGVTVYRLGSRPGDSGPAARPQIALSRGWHNVEVEFATGSCMDVDFSWRGPGESGFSVVPFTHLQPEL